MSIRRVIIVLALALPAWLAAAACAPAATTTMQSIFQDDPHLEANPSAVLGQMRMAGATVVKVAMRWNGVAPNPWQYRAPRGFNASDPRSYPGQNWNIFDTVVRDAAADGMAINFDLGGPIPIWATGPRAPRGKHSNWDPSPRAFAQFVRAVGIRYSGHFTPKGQKKPLPRVSNWSVWSEPNLGYSLAPQGVMGHLKIENSGRMYRNLLNAAWSALHQTGHAHDTILIGDLGPRGSAFFGIFAAMKPLIFIESLYCVDSRYRPLRGFSAAERGCPTTSAGSRRFRRANPALFQATGMADHMWARWYRPNVDPQHDPNYSGLPDLPHFERALDAIQRAYGSHKRFDIYNTEFGYITNPPNASAPFPSPTTAAYYLNWAEYISWQSARIKSFSQFLLQDQTPPSTGPYKFWSAGLFTYTGKPKITYSAWRLPLYLPVTSTKRGHTLEVWGCVRPATYAIADTGQPQQAELEFEPASSSTWSTLATITLRSKTSCYFDRRVKFPSSGTVRLTWTYPPGDPLLGNFPAPPTSSGTGTTTTTTTTTTTSTTPSGGYSDPLSGADNANPATAHSRTVAVTVK
jgi:hypothetical protein